MIQLKEKNYRLFAFPSKVIGALQNPHPNLKTQGIVLSSICSELSFSKKDQNCSKMDDSKLTTEMKIT